MGLEALLLFMSPQSGQQLLGLAFLVCGAGLSLSHLAILHFRYERLNAVLPPERQFDPTRMREHIWQFERTFRAKLPNDKSLYAEIGCIVGGMILLGIGAWIWP